MRERILYSKHRLSIGPKHFKLSENFSLYYLNVIFWKPQKITLDCFTHNLIFKNFWFIRVFWTKKIVFVEKMFTDKGSTRWCRSSVCVPENSQGKRFSFCFQNRVIKALLASWEILRFFHSVFFCENTNCSMEIY